MAESLNRAVRKARRRRTGKHVPCRICGKPTWVPQSSTADELCYECRSRTAGRLTTEIHHVLGRELDPDLTVEAPGNLHRDLSELELDWPTEVRNNPTRDP